MAYRSFLDGESRLLMVGKVNHSLGNYGVEILPSWVKKMNRIEELGGTHELLLNITYDQSIFGYRIGDFKSGDFVSKRAFLFRNGYDEIEEWVVIEASASHDERNQLIISMRLIWSAQYDLMVVYSHEHREPGMGSACSGAQALAYALEGSALWSVGECDVPDVAKGGGCVMIGDSAWERVQKVRSVWGGDLRPVITVATEAGADLVSRRLSLVQHIGDPEPLRQFNYGYDLKSITRHIDPGPRYCRVVPLGPGETEYAEDDETEFEWPTDILGRHWGPGQTPVPYIEDEGVSNVYRYEVGWNEYDVPVYEYPTKVVRYDESRPDVLYRLAMKDLHNHTRPKATYSGDIADFVRGGLDEHNLSLGDEVICTDSGEESVEFQTRITRIEYDELAGRFTNIELSNTKAGEFSNIIQSIALDTWRRNAWRRATSPSATA